MGVVYLAEETKLPAEANREWSPRFSPKIKKAPIRYEDRGPIWSASGALGFPATGSPGA